MIPGDFNNDPGALDTMIIKDKRSRKFHINGPPKKNKKRKSKFEGLDFTGTPMLRIPTKEQLAKRFGNPNIPYKPFQFETQQKERDDLLKPSEHEKLIMDQF
jgi:hypothetical protein